jgi:hypothetical protein
MGQGSRRVVAFLLLFALGAMAVARYSVARYS